MEQAMLFCEALFTQPLNTYDLDALETFLDRRVTL